MRAKDGIWLTNKGDFPQKKSLIPIICGQKGMQVVSLSTFCKAALGNGPKGEGRTKIIDIQMKLGACLVV